MKTIKRTMAIATLLLAMSQSMWAGGSYTYKWARVKVVCPTGEDKVYLSHDNGQVKDLSGKPIPDNTDSANEVDWTLILHSYNNYAVYVHGEPSNAEDSIFFGLVEDPSKVSDPINHFAAEGGFDGNTDIWKQQMGTVLKDRKGIEGNDDNDDSADDKLKYQTACNRVYAWKTDDEKKTDNSYYPQGVDKTYYAVFMKIPKVTLGEDGIATYSFPYGLYVKGGSDQEKLKIYGAKLVEGKIKLNDEYDGVDGKDKRAEMPGNTGVILIGEPGTYTFDYDRNGWVNGAKGEADNPYNDAVNVLKSTAEGEIVQDDSSDKNYYCLGKKKGVLGFYKVKDGQTIPANKAYIEVDDDGSAKDFIGFSDDASTTAIANIIGSHIQNDDYYNMQGQSVKENYRGIIIKEGKKYINK